MRPSVVAVVGLLLAGAPAARADAPTSEGNPNLYGETGLVRATSARTGKSDVMLAGHGFGFYSTDFVVPGYADANTFLGGHTAGSVALFEIVQLSIAAHAAANVNNVAGMQASVGDIIASLKAGYRFLPVAFAVDVRAFLPTRTREAGFAFSNSGFTGLGVFTLDLKQEIDIPLRVHANGGYTYQLGKVTVADQQFFEQNPNFLDGASGQLLALPTQQWFYDSVNLALAIEAPFPYVTPFIEASWVTAIGVPSDRGQDGGVYSLSKDAHLILTPGLRITPGSGFAIDVGADIGLTGNGGGLAVDVAQLVAGQPVNPIWLARLGVSHTFDPFAASSGAGPARAAAPTGQLTGCVTDEAGTPVPGAVVEGPSLHGARLAADAKGCFTSPPLAAGKAELSISAPGLEPSAVVTEVKDGAVTDVAVKLAGRVSSVPTAPVASASAGSVKLQGYVTNKADEIVDAEVEAFDAAGASRGTAKTGAGAFALEVPAGRAYLAARADKHLASGVEILAEPPGARATVVLKPVPKKRIATLEKERIALTGRIPFDYKTPRMQSAAEFALDEVVDVLLRNASLRVRVEVFAEGLDTPEAGQSLADERARAVVEYLAQHGVARRRLDTKGTAGVDEKSRRVEFVVVP